jgi:hypothetical protein
MKIFLSTRPTNIVQVPEYVPVNRLIITYCDDDDDDDDDDSALSH